MQETLFAFLRHGAYDQPPETPGAHLPHPLTPEGMEQAREAAPRLLALAESHGKRLHPVLETSSVLRAWQTADILARELTALGGEPFQLAATLDLAERSVGSVTNLTMQQIEEVALRDPRWGKPLPPGWKLDSSFRLPFPGAESLLEAGRRVLAHVSRTLDHLDGGQLDGGECERSLKVFVGHGGSFRHAAVAMGVLAAEDTPGLSMHYCQAIVFARSVEDGHTSWRHVDGAWKVRPTPKSPASAATGRNAPPAEAHA